MGSKIFYIKHRDSGRYVRPQRNGRAPDVPLELHPSPQPDFAFMVDGNHIVHVSTNMLIHPYRGKANDGTVLVLYPGGIGEARLNLRYQDRKLIHDGYWKYPYYVKVDGGLLVFGKYGYNDGDEFDLVPLSYSDLKRIKVEEVPIPAGIFDWVNSIPILGHAKAAIHAAVGEMQYAENAAKDASRPVAIVAAAALAAPAGPLGMAAAAASAGIAYDGVVSGLDSAVKGEYRPYGVIEKGDNMAKNVAEGNFGQAVANAVDLGVGAALDAIGGSGVGKGVVKAVASAAKPSVGDIVQDQAVGKGMQAVHQAGAAVDKAVKY